MDKKNTFLGIIFVAAGIGFMFWQSHQLQEQRREQLQQQEQAGATAPAEEATPEKSPQSTGESETSAPVITQAADADEFFKEAEVVEPVEAEPSAEEKTVTLSNDYIEAVFTTRGGAIRTVSFLQTKRGGRDDYVFNRGGLLPAMSLSYRTEEGRMR